MSLNRYVVSKRRYIEIIVDISGETIDICEKSLIYFRKYQMGYVQGKSKQKSWKNPFQLTSYFQFDDRFLLQCLVIG